MTKHDWGGRITDVIPIFKVTNCDRSGQVCGFLFKIVLLEIIYWHIGDIDLFLAMCN